MNSQHLSQSHRAQRRETHEDDDSTTVANCKTPVLWDEQADPQKAIKNLDENSNADW